MPGRSRNRRSKKKISRRENVEAEKLAREKAEQEELLKDHALAYSKKGLDEHRLTEVAFSFYLMERRSKAHQARRVANTKDADSTEHKKLRRTASTMRSTKRTSMLTKEERKVLQADVDSSEAAQIQRAALHSKLLLDDVRVQRVVDLCWQLVPYHTSMGALEKKIEQERAQEALVPADETPFACHTCSAWNDDGGMQCTLCKAERDLDAEAGQRADRDNQRRDGVIQREYIRKEDFQRLFILFKKACATKMFVRYEAELECMRVWDDIVRDLVAPVVGITRTHLVQMILCATEERIGISEYTPAHFATFLFAVLKSITSIRVEYHGNSNKKRRTAVLSELEEVKPVEFNAERDLSYMPDEEASEDDVAKYSDDPTSSEEEEKEAPAGEQVPQDAQPDVADPFHIVIRVLNDKKASLMSKLKQSVKFRHKLGSLKKGQRKLQRQLLKQRREAVDQMLRSQ
jgi:hypothetical protein